MILWVDDTRNPPNRFDYLWASTVRQAIMIIEDEEQVGNPLEYLDLDHDAGDYFFWWWRLHPHPRLVRRNWS